MDTIAVGWKGAIPATVFEEAIHKIGLTSADLSGDGEVQSGIQECMQALALDGILYLVQSEKDSTSNKVTSRIFDEICQDFVPCVPRLGTLLQDRIDGGQIWFFFAHDWPAGISVGYFEGTPQDLTSYLKLNGGAFRRLRSFSTKATNLDLDTPLVWKIIPQLKSTGQPRQ